MPIIIRDFDTMVEAICDRIIDANVGFTTKDKGSVLRTLVEAIALEMASQNYQIRYSYDSRGIDDAVGEDLDKAISILGVIRNPATKCDGIVRFGRSTPATYDIPIPVGRILSTSADVNGEFIEFIVTEVGKILSTGDTYVDVGVQSVVAGKTHVSAGVVTIMTEPVIGIEWVSNMGIIDGGSDNESDDDLRARAKLKLASIGKGTNDALYGALMDVDGVMDVSVTDMARGVGTSDISIVCATMPPTQEMRDTIDSVIATTKASGIDVAVVYPTVVNIDVIITLTKDPTYDTTTLRNAAGNAILSYFSRLGIGDTMIKNKLIGEIVNSSDGIIDMTMSTPADNTTATSTETIRVGTITIDGSVWVSG